MNRKKLCIQIIVDRGRARQWHARLISDLQSLGHEVRVACSDVKVPFPVSVSLLVALERLVCKSHGPQFSANWSVPTGDNTAQRAADLIIDLTPQGIDQPDVRTLRVLFSGSPCEESAYLDLLNGRPPVLEILDSRDTKRTQQYRIAVENTLRVSQAMDIVCARLMQFVVGAVGAIAAGDDLVRSSARTVPSSARWSFAQDWSALSGRATGILNCMLFKGPHWHVGWRFPQSDFVSQTLQIPKGGWDKLPDDGKRFYADPFPFVHNRRRWILVEEFPFATRKGILSAVEMDTRGPIGQPQPILDLPHHLSYPFVFEHDGQIWMIPESYSARRVELYRAAEFPWRWELAQVLIHDTEVHDPTILFRDGRVWLFGTVTEASSSSWDSLRIWSAETLLGTWTICGDDHVLVDACGARPAGAFFLRGQELWRPAQDCTAGYGAGLALARVDRLDLGGFSQTVKTVLRPNADWPGSGFHTLNSAGDLETVDGCRR